MEALFQLEEIKNLTTNLDLLSSEPGQALEVIEYGDQSLVFQSKVQAMTGHLVSLRGKMQMRDKTYKFSATGRIENISSSSGNVQRFEVHLNQFDKSQWDNFISAMREKQDRVEAIFKMIKGGER